MSNQRPTDNDLHEAWRVYEQYGYVATDAAEALGTTEASVRRRVALAQKKFAYARRDLGQDDARQAKRLALPAKGEVRRYILTCAQNNTPVHRPTWQSLVNLAEHYGAEIKVSTFTYIRTQEGSGKRGRETGVTGRFVEDRWYAPEVEPFISDAYEQIGHSLVWCGHHNTLPTATDPLSRADNLNGRASGIFPHTRQEMRSVAASPGEATKLNYSTGTVTLQNYVQKRAGIAAEFYHTFGALLVEVNQAGDWWVRQLNADKDGTIFDLEVFSDPEGVWQNEAGCEAVVFGDIHVASLESEQIMSLWGEGGLVDVMQPKRQVFHDLFDMNARGHHNRKDPHIMYELFVRGQDSVTREIGDVAKFLAVTTKFSPVAVVDSNHDRHIDRWLKEADWRSDLPNARTILETNLALLSAIEANEGDEFVALEWLSKKSMHKFPADRVTFLNMKSRDPKKQSLVVCKDKSGGIELALHGDIGPNGARGSGRNLSRLGQKNVIGHSHSAGIYGGTYQVGVTGALRQGYNVGPSSWSHTNCIIYPNGKRQLITVWKGKWRAA